MTGEALLRVFLNKHQFTTVAEGEVHYIGQKARIYERITLIIAVQNPGCSSYLLMMNSKCQCTVLNKARLTQWQSQYKIKLFNLPQKQHKI